MASRLKGAARKAGRRPPPRRFGYVKWIVGVGVLAVAGYAVSQAPSYPYTDRHLGMIDFSPLSRTEKDTAIEAANKARCPCSCGMTLAQCVATDTTCPLRSENVDKIRRMVDNAKGSRPTS